MPLLMDLPSSPATQRKEQHNVPDNAAKPLVTPIPVIHLDDPDEEALINALWRACTDTGFFYLEGHGVSTKTIDNVFDQSKALFSLPQQNKMELYEPQMGRGYTRMGEERLDPSNQRDRGDSKEAFLIGQDISPYSANVYPDEAMFSSPEESIDFKSAMDAYYDETSEVAKKLARLLLAAAGARDKGHAIMDSHFQTNTAVFKLLHYSAEKSNPDEGLYGCGAHSDYGMLTLLLADSPGLQILTPREGWMDIPLRPRAYIVNIGDMLQRWTNGLFRSTVHRVLTSGDQERFSVPFFFGPDLEATISCLPECCSPSNPAKYPPTILVDYL